MVSFPNAEVRQACAGIAPQLKAIPAGVDPERLALAIAAVESGGGDPDAAGHDCQPRHEPAYDTGGSFYRQSSIQRDLVTQFGSAAAYSYGPWQMMFCNFATGTTPEMFASIDTFALNFVRWFNLRMPRFAPKDLASIGEIWNAGSIRPDPVYVQKLSQAYAATQEETTDETALGSGN